MFLTCPYIDQAFTLIEMADTGVNECNGDMYNTYKRTLLLEGVAGFPGGAAILHGCDEFAHT
jgi:hypothetical protein